MNEQIEKLQKIIDESNKIVFFGGAGVSTESGLKDFRSVDGLYNEKYDYPPEEILSADFFYDNTREFYRFYYDKLLVENVFPNDAHLKLYELEKAGKLLAIVTQNIDGLHQMAGTQRISELHGSVLRNYCMRCRKSYSAQFIKSGSGVPRCCCGGIIKPDVVLYEESLDGDTIEASVDAIEACDLLIVAGTSLTVYPAAGLINYYRGERLVLINRDSTPFDSRADLVLHKSLGDVFSQLP
jgi:NAD-dependent deacetylase